jgi:putative zinc finger protein
MSEMDCDGLRKVLFDHVDGLLGREEADAARDHLAACGPCRSLQEEVRRNFGAMDAWEDEELPAGAFERLRDRLPSSVSAGSASPGGSIPLPGRGPGPRRRWLRLAVPYAAGLATAASAGWFFVHAAPGAATLPAPAAGAPRDGGAAPAGPVALNDAAPAAPAPASLRAGERMLEFREPNGVLRKVRLPRDVDPGMITLVDAPGRVLQDDEGVK